MTVTEIAVGMDVERGAASEVVAKFPGVETMGSVEVNVVVGVETNVLMMVVVCP